MRFVVRFTAAGFAIPLALLTGFLPALAWTQLDNAYDTGGTTSCGGSTTYACLYWQEPNYTAINVNAYLDSSLTIGGYSMGTATTTAFSNWNAILTAWSPNFYACYTGGCGSVAYSGAYLDCGVYGGTSFSRGSVGTDSRNGEYYKFILSATVVYNNSGAINWNSNLDYTHISACDDNADGRKVAAHETGHVLGLGHTGYTAVMHQGPENFYTPQQNDINGLNSIYPGNPPS